MGYARQIFKAIQFIEAHLTDELSLLDVADQAAYSMYHFHRLFQTLTGETPGGYIRKRRLVKAAETLVYTNRKIIDVALDYQFGSQEAFTRAFQAMFGTPPGQFRKRDIFKCPAISPSTIKVQMMHYRGGEKMKPEILTLNKMALVGMIYYGDNAQGEIKDLWTKLGPRMKEIKGKKGWCAYGLCIEPDDYEKTGLFQYVACVEVENLDEIPMDMVGKIVPANTYAVFTHKGPVSGLRNTYENIFGNWINQADVEVIPGFDFELYDDRFTSPDDPNSEIDIYIPIQRSKSK